MTKRPAARQRQIIKPDAHIHISSSLVEKESLSLSLPGLSKRDNPIVFERERERQYTVYNSIGHRQQQQKEKRRPDLLLMYIFLGSIDGTVVDFYRGKRWRERRRDWCTPSPRMSSCSSTTSVHTVSLLSTMRLDGESHCIGRTRQMKCPPGVGFTSICCPVPTPCA